MNTNSSINRRDFMRTTALLGGYIALNQPATLLPAQSAPDMRRPSWIDKPMRWAQLTLVEDDPGKFDLDFWLDYFKRTHSDAACLSAGGCVAYYPTKVKFHHRSQWLGDSDPFGDLVAGCRKLGMVVAARTDPHATYQDVFEARPDWIAVDADGDKRGHWSSPEMWLTCCLGPYNFEFMTQVIKEIVAAYRVDAIFINRWDGSGMCYCEHCRQNFKSDAGLDLPRNRDPQDKAYRSYLKWRQDRLFDLWQLWDTEARRINPDACVVPNTGGGAMSQLNMRIIGERAEMLCADRQARRGLMPPWANGKNAKEYRATLGQKPVIGIFSVGVEEPYRWKDSVQSSAELRIWIADGIANGMRPWFTKFSGALHDGRWLETVESIYKWHHRSERYLRNVESLARAAIVYSQQTATFYGGQRAHEKVEDHTLGFYHALIEGRVPFEMAHDELLSPEHIDKFKLLILPDIAALSDQQCDQLRSFVKRGGSIVATYETSLYDEHGNRRPDFGLADVFGVSFTGQLEGPMRNSYLRLEKDRATGKVHPILAGLEDAPRIINGVWRVHVQPTTDFPYSPLTLIPSYPDLPMEKVYPRVPKTNISQVYLREFGQGRVVYFPWDIDRAYWEVMCVDHGKLLRNAVEWAVNEPQPVAVTGPGILDVTVWRQQQSMTVHLVNLTNPMMMKGPIRELIPIGKQHVRLRLPNGARPNRVQLLVSGKMLDTSTSNGYLNVIVPEILDHEVLAIDL